MNSWRAGGRAARRSGLVTSRRERRRGGMVIGVGVDAGVAVGVGFVMTRRRLDGACFIRASVARGSLM